ncbi:MAG: transposase [Bacteroidales bacterium]|nr:transposase [Bacteroidales bacterium]
MLYFLTTDHLETKIWFRDDDDFRAGMNYVAVTVASTNLAVLAFVLMSNHVHFLIECGRKEDVNTFIIQFKRLFGSYCHRKYGTERFFRSNGVDIQSIPPAKESVERVIAYIVMNPVAARICAAPSGYRWGSGSCYFNDNRQQGIPVGSLSAKKRAERIRSKLLIPDEWLLSCDNYILPDSYIQIRAVERLFRNPARYNYFLNSSSKARKIQESSGPVFRDQVLADGLNDLCVSLFGKGAPGDLSPEEMTEAIKQLRRRFGADAHQISRITGIPYEDVNEALISP